MVTRKIVLDNIDEAINLFGHLDSNIQRIEKECGVQIFIRHAHGSGSQWPTLSVRGAPGKVDRALKTLEELRLDISRRKKSGDFFTQDTGSLSQSLDTMKHQPISILDEENIPKPHHDAVYITSFNSRIMPRTPQQKNYVELMRRHDVVFAIGPAGTGKTFLAVACALADLKKGRVSKIVLTRPVVEAGEKLGFLPGDFYEKVNPYLRPLYDAFYYMLGPEKFRLFKDDETIEIVPLAYMRGRTMNDAFVILDEAQNTTYEQMKMFLTRMGSNSKIVVTGDVTQIDLENKKRSGLIEAVDIFKSIKEIKIIRLTEEDVIRHEIVKKIIKAYEQWEQK